MNNFILICLYVLLTKLSLGQLSPRVPTRVSKAIKIPVRSIIIQPPVQGGDIGISVMNAITTLDSTCGTIVIPNGNYQLSTQIVKPRCVLIDGGGSVITVTSASVKIFNPNAPAGSPTATSKAAIVTGDLKPSGYPAFAGDYARGGIAHLTLFGPGPLSSAVGIWMGSGAQSLSGTYWDFLETFTDISIENFSHGVEVGENAYQNAFMGGALVENQEGLWWNQPSSATENLSMFGTQILNNLDFGINVTSASGDLNLYGCSLDYNGVGAIHWENGVLNIMGGHFEQAHGYMISSLSSSFSTIHIGGGTGFATTSADGADDAYFFLTSPNIHFTMDDGVGFGTNHPYNGIIYFNGGGADNRFNLGTYFFSERNLPTYIESFTPASITPNVVIAPINTSFGSGSGSQVGMSFPFIQVTSQKANSGTRYACFDTSGNLISSTAPCSGN